MSDSRTFGQQLRLYQMRAGMSLIQLAQAAGVDRATLASLANDATSPSAELIKKIADTLHLTDGERSDFVPRGWAEVLGESRATQQPPSIFISYRRDDSAAGHAGRLCADLTRHYGSERVFMDLGIEPGADFVETLETTVGSCSVLLAVIGRNWLTVTDSNTGRRRLDNPKDWVRIEIATALSRNILVVPILAHGAKMPGPEALPKNLKPLARRQAYEVRDSHWDDDIAGLIKSIDDELKDTPAPAAPGLAACPELAIEAARQYFLWSTFPYDRQGRLDLDRLHQRAAIEAQTKERLRKRRLSHEPAFQVGDIVERVNDQIPDWSNSVGEPPASGPAGVVCAVAPSTADVSWYVHTNYTRTEWAHPETIPLDQLELLDIGPYPPPPSGAVTMPEQRDISIGHSMVIALQTPNLVSTAPGTEIQWVLANRLGRNWEAGDIVRRGGRPAEPGGKAVSLGQMSVISGYHKSIVQVSWYYKDGQGNDCWQNPEVVPVDQLLWFKIVDQSTKGHPATGS
jgi:transcriptional regulator with XRE-family HTH domain